MAKRRTRWIIIGLVAMAVIAALVLAFLPKPMLVDLGTVERRPMIVTVDEDARTRVRDAYIVSAPITGRLLRVELKPGDPVVRGETVVARMLPPPPSALDVRTREQAQAAVHAAEAALRLARADLNKVLADKELADANLARVEKLFASGTASQAALDQARREHRAVQATLDTARAAIAMREAELKNAQAQLISFDDQRIAAAIGARTDAAIPLRSPTNGRVLRVIQENEMTIQAGTPILEIGDIEAGLEVVVELLSTDAVRIKTGDRVIIDKWGGPHTLSGVVERIDPWGFTKYSALGVEEQRVNGLIRFTDPPELRQSLGHGYRVEVRIVVWEDEDALVVPSSALFRNGDDWAVFVVSDGVATQRAVQVNQNNGVTASIDAGLEEGEVIVLYPAAGLTDGTRVAQRTAG